MTPDERAAAIEATVAHRFAGGRAWGWTHDGVLYSVSDFRRIPKGFEVTVAASDVNGPVPVDNPYRFINPPTKGTRGRHALQEMVEDAL